MTGQLFDTYDKSYGEVVQSSIDFSGLSHGFFMEAKAELLRDVLATHFDPAQKLDALDVGCGIGAFHQYVRGMFGRLCGVDVSASSVTQARQSNPDVEYKTYTDGVIPHADGEFDVATAICVMHHVPPAEWVHFARELRRVTRPGGVVCVIEHNPFNPLTRLAVSRCEFDRVAVLLRAGRLQRLMTEAGLREVTTRYFLFLPWASSVTRRIERSFGRLPLGAQYMTCGTV